jgi:hypothetical protein
MVRVRKIAGRKPAIPHLGFLSLDEIFLRRILHFRHPPLDSESLDVALTG